MFWVSLIKFVFGFLQSILTIYFIVVIAACFVSFVNPDPYNKIVILLRRLTEPTFRFIRKLLPFVVLSGGLDLSPLVLVFFVQLVQSVLLPSIQHSLLLMLQ